MASSMGRSRPSRAGWPRLRWPAPRRPAVTSMTSVNGPTLVRRSAATWAQVPQAARDVFHQRADISAFAAADPQHRVDTGSKCSTIQLVDRDRPRCPLHLLAGAGQVVQADDRPFSAPNTWAAPGRCRRGTRPALLPAASPSGRLRHSARPPSPSASPVSVRAAEGAP